MIRPSKILWVFPKPEADADWTNKIPSKSVQRLARKTKSLLQQAGISIDVVPLTESLYQEWHAYYAKTMLSQDHEVLAAPEWFIERRMELPPIWLMDFRKNGERVGASIISGRSNGVFSHHYKASDRLLIPGPDNTSLGGLMELYFLDYAFSQSPRQVNSGRSRNAFGFYNTLGYLAAKLRMGYIPELDRSHPWDDEFLRKSEQTPTIWFVERENKIPIAWIFPTIGVLSGELKTYFDRQRIYYELAKL